MYGTGKKVKKILCLVLCVTIYRTDDVILEPPVGLREVAQLKRLKYKYEQEIELHNINNFRCYQDNRAKNIK